MGLIVFVLVVMVTVLWLDLSKIKKEVASLNQRLSSFTAPAIASGRSEAETTVSYREAEPEPDEEIASPVETQAAAPVSPPMPPRTMKPVIAKRDESVTPAVSASAPRSRPDTIRRESQGFENLFGRTLPIWAGGLTLAITGILGVKWSIDAGILSEGVRVFLGMLFGVGLIVGAFLTVNRDDDRIPQALSGAGVASLYGAVLSAHLLYGLIGTETAMTGMVVVTLIGGGLSMIFGAPSALLALVGGLAAPALIGGEGNVPLLSLYVVAVTGGAAMLARLQDRLWLSSVALGGGVLWTVAAAFMAGSQGAFVFVIALALFAGIGVPLIATSKPGKTGSMISPVGACIATIQCAGLVVLGGYGMIQWLGLLIATVASLILSSKPKMAFLPSVAGGIVFFTLTTWREAEMSAFALAVLVFGAVHAGHAAWAMIRQMKGRPDIRLMAVPVAGASLLVLQRLPETGVISGVICLVAAALLAAIIEFAQDKGSKASKAFQAVGVVLASAGSWWAFGEALFPLAVSLIGAVALWRRGWLVASLTAIGIVAGVSIIAVAPWIEAALKSLGGLPFLASDLPAADVTFRSLLPLAVIAGLAAWKLRDRSQVILGSLSTVAVFAVGVMVHFGWKSLFGIEGPQEFVQSGMLERAGWEALLAVLAVVAWKFSERLSIALGAMSLTHFGWYSLFLHNPLLVEQAVGPVPVANLIGLSFAVAFGLLLQTGRMEPIPSVERGRRVIQMGVIVVGVFMLVRQIFAGSIIAGVEIGQMEDITHSVAAIGVALGLLVYGMQTKVMDWRIGSLVLMLAAVVKVFLFDAAGLDGLARIISFAALGFALIGVGWLYAKLLPDKA